MSDQIIDQVESIATTFDKPAENVIFMKELLAKTKPLPQQIQSSLLHQRQQIQLDGRQSNGIFLTIILKKS